MYHLPLHHYCIHGSQPLQQRIPRKHLQEHHSTSRPIIEYSYRYIILAVPSKRFLQPRP